VVKGSVVFIYYMCEILEMLSTVWFKIFLCPICYNIHEIKKYKSFGLLFCTDVKVCRSHYGNNIG
jgi:hypothetical protein